MPVTVSRMIEKSPTGAPYQNVKGKIFRFSFWTSKGYTKLCAKLGSNETSEIIERHFSVFMDAIYANNGDVNETAGDGLMVLFLNDDKQANALEAVRTAIPSGKRPCGFVMIFRCFIVRLISIWA